MDESDVILPEGGIEEFIKNIEHRKREAEFKYHYNKVTELLKEYNVKVNDEEMEVLLHYSHIGDVTWLIRFMKDNKHSLLKALVSYHDDWSGIQGG